MFGPASHLLMLKYYLFRCFCVSFQQKQEKHAITYILYIHNMYMHRVYPCCMNTVNILSLYVPYVDRYCYVILYTACHLQLCYLLRYDVYCALCIVLYSIIQNILILGVAFLCARHMNLHYVYIYREGYGYRHKSTYTGHFILGHF